MGILDSALRDLASILIGTFSDVPATFTRTPLARYDGRTGQELTVAPTNYSLKISPPAPYNKREMGGTAVQARDLRCYTAASDLPVEADPRTDSLTWKGVTFQVIAITPYGTADANVLLELQLRI